MRFFLSLCAALLLLAGQAPARAEGGMPLLTVAGTIDKANRGPLDPFRDALLAKLVPPFGQAYQFDAEALAALPQRDLSLSYATWDGQTHAFRGPALADVLAAAGAQGKTVTVKAVDGYGTTFDLTSVKSADMILATEMDGRPLGLGGRGPLWLVFPPGTAPDLKGDDDSGLVWAVVVLLVN